MTQQYGLGGISVFVPPYRVDLQQWCQWSGSDFAKIGAVVGHSFRMAGPEHNAYTLAAQAVLNLILDNSVDPASVGHLALATESSSDNAVGAVVVRGLVDMALAQRGLPPLSRYCEVPEIKQACIAGVYGLKGAVRYLAHDGAGRNAIVAAVDIAEYEQGSTGEPTQGAGAAAMLVEADPRLLRLDLRSSGSASSYRIADFRKPFLRFAGQVPGDNGRLRDFPVFNGKYSTACYLDEVMCAFDALFERRGGPRAEFLRGLAAAFMHRPYHHMPVSAWSLAYLFALGADGGDEHRELEAYCTAAGVALAQVLAEMRQRPELARAVAAGEAPPEEPYPLCAHVVKAFRRSPRYKEVVEGKLRLGAASMMHVGNLYTAALPAWLAAGFEEALHDTGELAGRPLLLVGYGSGDAAETLVAEAAPGWRQAAARIGLARMFAGAVDLSQAQYRSLHDGRRPADLAAADGSGFAIGRVGTSRQGAFQDFGVEYYRYAKQAAASG
ncbi:MAG: hydroxymethylglutaryl-CoA synthase [Nevskia sp.]|nr:hydroxymethylglutaryl-CoA synthase [Nevskia sp.]